MPDRPVMPTPIAMPKLGMTMREGRVLAWPVPLGARVEKGQPILAIESEKAEVEVEAPVSGVLRHVYVAPDTTVPCGTLLAALTDTADEPFDAAAFRRAHDRPEPAASPTFAAPARSVAAPSRAGGAPVTPAARAAARQLGIDVAAVPGSGPGGRVTKEDIEAWVERRRARVEVAPGVALEVPAQGRGDPVLLLPGFGVDASLFARQIPVLAQRFRVLGVNPRGVGLSDAPEAALYGVDQAAADAAAVVDRPAHVVGASLGAAVAIELALTHPERVGSLVLITPFVDANARLLSVVEAWCDLARETGAESLARALLPWLFSTRFLADASARDRTRRGLAAVLARVPAPTLERSAAGLRAWSGTRRGDLARIAVPTLVIVAGEDLLTPHGEDIGAAIPGAVTRVIPDAGHAVALETAEEVSEAVRRHLGDDPAA